MSSNSEQLGHPEPAPSTYALLRRSATSLRADASLLEAVVSLKGDEGGATAQSLRELGAGTAGGDEGMEPSRVEGCACARG